MICPRCTTKLVTKKGGAAKIQACPGCHGAWVSDEAVAALTNDPAARHVLLPETRGAANPTDAQIPCLKCAAPMWRRPLGAIIVDTCPKHGTWYDATELDAAVEAAAQVGVANPTASKWQAHRKVEKKERKGEGAGAILEGLVAVMEIIGAILEIFA